MDLKSQINLVVFSILFGLIFSFYLRLIYPYIIKQKRIVYYILSFLTIFNFTLFYFVMLLKINNGLLHIYSFLCIVIGFIIEYTLHLIIDKHIKK